MKGVRCWLAIAIALLAGCATTPVGPEFKFDPAATSGLVVASFTRIQFPEKKGVGLNLYRDIDTQVYRDFIAWSYRRVGAEKSKWLVVAPVGSGAALPIGDAFVVPFVLEEGDYEFHAWTQPRAGIYYKSVSPFSIRFHVTRGKVTYIGNVSLQALEEKGKAKLSYRMPIEDRSAKETPVVLARYPNLHASDVEVALMQRAASEDDTGTMALPNAD